MRHIISEFTLAIILFLLSVMVQFAAGVLLARLVAFLAMGQ